MLTPLQERIRAALAGVAGDAELALAGAGALVASDVVDRPTNDLDFFARYPSPHAETVDLVQGALEADGLRVTRITDRPGFARLQVESSDGSTEVDVGINPRIAPAVRIGPGAVLALTDLAADKVLALEARAEARDFIDFAALAERFTLAELCALAAEKDGGFHGSRLATRLAAFEQIGVEEFAEYQIDYHNLRATIAAAAAEVARLHPGPDPSGFDV